jgi:hypothetical protein
MERNKSQQLEDALKEEEHKIEQLGIAYASDLHNKEE